MAIIAASWRSGVEVGVDCGIPVVIRVARASGGATRRVPAMSAVEHFDFSFTRAYRAAARPFGIKPATAWVEITGAELKARFGPWRVSTPLSNVVDAVTTGPYAFLKTAGPARLAITDRGLTFATTGTRGVLISFDRPVHGLDPLGLLRHPELTVTVREVDRLAALLNEHRTPSGS